MKRILVTGGAGFIGSAFVRWPLEQNPDDRVYRIATGIGQMRTHQYEKAAENGYRFVKVLALQSLGRTEEASILAQEYGSEGSIQTWFSQLNRSGQSQKLIEYLDGTGDIEIYHLAKDLGESKNLEAERKGKIADLKKNLAAWRTRTIAGMPIPNPSYDPARAHEWWNRRTGKPVDSTNRKRFPQTEKDQ